MDAEKDKASVVPESKKGWLVLFALVFCGIIVMMNQYKVAPMMSQLMGYFQLNAGNAGWLNSIFAIAGIVLAVPAAALMRNFGPKFTGLVGVGCTVLGVTVGVFADVATVLYIGRVIEGVGAALIGVVAPSIISMYFGREKAGMPMGIWNMWYPAGSTLAYNLAYPVADTFGAGNWQTWWWFSDILALIAFIIFAVVITVPKGRERTALRPSELPKAVPFSEGFKVKRMWYLALAFCFLMFTSLSFLTWAPTYFAQEFGLDPASAGHLSSIGYGASLPMTLVCGALMARFKTIQQRNVMLLVCAIYELSLYPWAFLVPIEYMTVYLILCGIGTGFTAGVVWAAVPITMPKKTTMPVGMALITIFQGVANLTATPIVGYVVQDAAGKYTWTNAIPIIFVAAAISLTFIVLYIKTEPETFEEDLPVADVEFALSGE